jgi:hypothetical protein
MKNFILYLTLALLVVIGVLVYNATHNITEGNILASVPAPLQPIELRIPAIQVDASIINEGQTADGRMDTPVSQAINSPYWTHVFWYAPGAAPGQPGNAVIAGHVDRVGGDPAVFWFLQNLAPGDDIFVTNAQKQVLHFVVNRAVSYPVSDPGPAVLNAIFGPTTGDHLNLITCSGAWTGSGYDQRLVIFTTLVH